MARGPRGRSGEPGDPHADLAGNGDPVDVSAVRRDDALIDAISAGGPVSTDGPEEYQVAALLANWRAEIVAQPLPAEPDLDDIVARVQAELGAREALVTGTRSGRNHLRLLRPIAAAAAVVAIAMGGMTIFSYNAEPGDPLWGVKQVVFTQRAESTVAKIDTTSNLEDAERLIATGDTAAAKAKLDSAATRASAVNEAGTRQELIGWRKRLLTALDKAAPPVVPPTAPEVPPVTGGQPSTVPDDQSGPSSTWIPSPTLSQSPSTVPSTSPAPTTSASETTSTTPTPTSSPATTPSSSGTPTSSPATSTTRASSATVGGSSGLPPR